MLRDQDASAAFGAWPGVKLLSAGRFGHTASYVRAAAGESGFAVEAATRDVLRTQNGAPVASITFTLRKHAQ